MTTLFLLGLALCPRQADPVTPEELSRTLGLMHGVAANKAAQGDANAAIRTWTEYLNGLPEFKDEPRANVVNGFRCAALQARASQYSKNNQPSAAIADYTQVLMVYPDVPHYYLQRAEMWEKLGQTEKAAADRRSAEEIQSRYASTATLPEVFGFRHIGRPNWHVGPFVLFWGKHHDDQPRLGQQLSAALFVTGIVWLLLFILNTWTGRRQMRDGNGRWPRLLLVAGLLALLEATPFATIFAVVILNLSVIDVGSTVFAGLVVQFVVALFGLAWMRPMRWKGTKTAPPLLEDEAALERVRAIAAGMGIETPVVRVHYSTSSQQETTAAASSLAAPCLLISDGVLNRLSPQERDCILAHEMAHLANYSLWLWALVMAICAVATVLSAAVAPGGSFLLFGFAVWTGMHRIVNRWLEFDCDRRGAQAVGFREMTSALEKIHAGEKFRHSRLEPLITATSTHPSRNERLAALHAAAPAEDRPEVTFSPSGARVRRMLAMLVGLIWLSAVGVSVYVSRIDPFSWTPNVLLLGVIFIPAVLLLAGARKELLRALRRAMPAVPIHWWIRCAGGVLLFAYFVLNWLDLLDVLLPFDQPIASLVHAGMLIGLLIMIWFPNLSRSRKLERDVAVAFHSRDFEKALEIAAGRPEIVARSPVLRHNLALAKALLGDRQIAMQELDQLRREAPKLKQTWLTLAAVCTDEGELERAVELTREIEPRLSGDPAPHLQAAWALRRLGRLEEAEEELQQAQDIDDRAATGHSIAAAIALDRGQFDEAWRQLDRAEQLAPGDVGNTFVEAEIALRTGASNAHEILDRLDKAVRENPFALLDNQVVDLRSAEPV